MCVVLYSCVFSGGDSDIDGSGFVAAGDAGFSYRSFVAREVVAGNGASAPSDVVAYGTVSCDACGVRENFGHDLPAG